MKKIATNKAKKLREHREEKSARKFLMRGKLGARTNFRIAKPAAAVFGKTKNDGEKSAIFKRVEFCEPFASFDSRGGFCVPTLR